MGALDERLAVTAAAYDAVSGRYARLVYREHGLVEPRLDQAMLTAFAGHVRDAGGGLVADAGCGEGRIAAYLAAQGLDVTGIDLSPSLIAIARATRPGIPFQVGSMHALPFGDGALAGAVSWYSLIHADPGDVPGYLTELGRAVRPGGYLLAAFFEAVSEPVTAFDHKVTTAYRWPLDELAAAAAEAGFAEEGRMSREPLSAERFRRGHLLARRR